MNRFNLGLFKEFNLEQDEGGQIMTVFIFAQTIQVICFQWIRVALFQKIKLQFIFCVLLTLMPCTSSTKHNNQELLQTKRDISKVKRHLWFNLWSGKHSSRNRPVQGPGSRTHLKHTQKTLLMNYRRITNTL